MEKCTVFMDWKNQYCENEYTIQSNLWIQCNLYQATNDILHRTRTNNFKICMEIHNTLNSQSNLEKEEWNWRNQPAWLQALLQSHSHQDSMVLAQRQKYRSMAVFLEMQKLSWSMGDIPFKHQVSWSIPVYVSMCKSQCCHHDRFVHSSIFLSENIQVGKGQGFRYMGAEGSVSAEMSDLFWFSFGGSWWQRRCCWLEKLSEWDLKNKWSYLGEEAGRRAFQGEIGHVLGKASDTV